MPASTCGLCPAEIVDSLVERMIQTGVDLKTVTLEDFKRTFAEAIRRMLKQPSSSGMESLDIDQAFE